MEGSHSGLVRTPGTRVYRKVSRVRISPLPPEKDNQRWLSFSLSTPIIVSSVSPSRSAVVARLHGVQEVVGSTPLEYRLSKRQDVSFDKIGQLFPVSVINNALSVILLARTR